MGARVFIGTNKAAVYDPSVLELGSATRGLLGTYTLATSDYYEVTSMVASVSTKRGRGDTELDPCGTGTARVVLIDQEGLFDPTYRESPLYPGARSGLRVAITNDDLVPLFTGRLDDSDVDREGPFTGRVSLECMDEMGVFAQANLTATARSAEPIDDRIGWVLSLLNFTGVLDAETALNTAVAVNTTTVKAEGNAAKHLSELARSEGFGFLFINRAGQVRFLRRRTTLGSPSLTFTDRVPADQFTRRFDNGVAAVVTVPTLDGGGAVSSTPTLTVDGGGAAVTGVDVVPYRESVGASLGKTIINRSTVTARNGTVRTASNALSIQENGLLDAGGEIRQSEAWWSDNPEGAEANRQASWIVSRFGDGGYGVVEVTIDTDQLGEIQREAVAAIELGDVVRALVHPPYDPAAQTFQQDALVVGVSHSCGASGYGLTTTVRLAATTGTIGWS